jgi:hypothetical protein
LMLFGHCGDTGRRHFELPLVVAISAPQVYTGGTVGHRLGAIGHARLSSALRAFRRKRVDSYCQRMGLKVARTCRRSGFGLPKGRRSGDEGAESAQSCRHIVQRTSTVSTLSSLITRNGLPLTAWQIGHAIGKRQSFEFIARLLRVSLIPSKLTPEFSRVPYISFNQSRPCVPCGG